MAYYLVTGGAGFIGSSIVRELVRRNERVRVFDNFSEGKRENLADLMDKIELIEGDIRDASALAKAVRGVDYVSHQAALRSVERSVIDPSETNDVNVRGTLNLLLACRDQKVKRVVYASSSSVYGDSDHLPTSETSATHPISPYAISKLAAEHYCIAFTRLYGLETASLRYFNVFGPHQDPASEYAAVIPKFILKLLRNEPPTIDGDGEQSRDFSYIDDVVAANLKAATTPGIAGEVFNVAGGKGHSVAELHEMINQILGKSIRPKSGPPRAGDVRRTLADLSKSRRLLNHPFETDFKKGLEKTIEWLRSLTKE